MKKPKTEMCPCCGFENSGFSFCPACHHHQGSTDEDKTIWRNMWARGGMQWQNRLIKQPKNWNPLNTLAALALKATRARTKGRPPRMN